MIKSLLRLAYLKFTGSLHPGRFPVYTDYIEIDLPTKRFYFPQCSDEVQIIDVEHVEVNGIEYEKGLVLVVEMGHDDRLDFGQISKIFIKNQVSFFFFEY